MSGRVAQKPIVCRDCGEDRVQRWEEARAKNGLTEQEWPRPTAPEFRDLERLQEHRANLHGARP